MYPLKNQLAIVALLATLALTSCSTNEEDLLVEEPKALIETIASSNLEVDIMAAINSYRQTINKPNLTPLNIIKVPALEHTNYMIKNDVLTHDHFSSRANFLVENAHAKVVSENLAYGFNAVKDLVKGWLDSEGHKKNIEGDYTHFEVIARKNNEGKWYYTNIFIKK